MPLLFGVSCALYYISFFYQVKISGGTQTEYSLSPQLSAGTRERLMMASPKPRHIDGSLSDSNYAEISSPYGAWLRHSGAYTASLPARTTAGQRHSCKLVNFYLHSYILKRPSLRDPNVWKRAIEFHKADSCN